MSRSSNWLRIAAGGVLWSAVYNGVWAAAWFAFMRHEWREATAAAHHSMPWTPAVWVAWVATTVPLGIAISAYTADSRPVATTKAVSASVGLWVLMTIGIVVLGRQESWSVRVLILDSTVDLAAVLVAGVAVGWSGRAASADRRSPASSTT